MHGDTVRGCNCFLHRQEVEWNNVYQTGCIKSRPFGADDVAPSPEYRSACVSVCVFARACVWYERICAWMAHVTWQMLIVTWRLVIRSCHGLGCELRIHTAASLQREAKFSISVKQRSGGGCQKCTADGLGAGQGFQGIKRDQEMMGETSNRQCSNFTLFLWNKLQENYQKHLK